MNPIAKEPVVVAGLASIIVWFGARYGFNIDPAFATAAAGAVLVVAGGYARQLVTPTAKLPAGQGNASNSDTQVILYPTAEGEVVATPRKGQVSPARTVPPQKVPGPPPPPPGVRSAE